MRLSQWPSFAQIAVSAFLLLTAVLELFDTMLEDFIGVEVTTAHGLFVFAMGKILKEWLEVKEKFLTTREKLSESREAREATHHGEAAAETRTA
ncbi:hypothetical protein [Azospirillum rugosum]|uniref:Uncharacterized protein n=1 Tax=Azospirillum rugosum TaxID=416170 RepID=A0ABS4SIE6_9PROT|nr:hypothetical protein [Azospirillum rugosum]MBP2292272.1 hypothetical protein [Azospirillum rugosum]MDQ0526031.1 hypothetical protein [Azospirillum rugosum]